MKNKRQDKNKADFSIKAASKATCLLMTAFTCSLCVAPAIAHQQSSDSQAIKIAASSDKTKTIVEGPHDGILIKTSGKNSITRGGNNVLYLKGGTLFLMVKAPAKEVTEATKMGIVKVHPGEAVFVSLFGKKLVVQCLISERPGVRVALNRERFSCKNDKERLIILRAGMGFASQGKAIVADEDRKTLKDIPADEKKDDKEGKDLGKDVALPDIVETSPFVEIGKYDVSKLSPEAMAAAADTIDRIAMRDTNKPWQYLYYQDFCKSKVWAPLIVSTKWYRPPGYDWANTILEAKNMPLEPGEQKPKVVDERGSDLAEADNLTDDDELNDEEADHDGTNDAEEDDGDFDDDESTSNAPAPDPNTLPETQGESEDS
jgi:hypothetical protein